jgi:nickel-dependent lactate racemase
MPESGRLNVNETFDSQKGLVTAKIIPALLKELDPATYPIGEGVLYEIIHQRHRHQREEMLRKKKGESNQAKESIRRHGNSRRKEVTALINY